MKTCEHCKEVKELSCFSKKMAAKDHLNERCKDCDKKMRLAKPGRWKEWYAKRMNRGKTIFNIQKPVYETKKLL